MLANLKTMLHGEEMRLEDAEYEIRRLERKLTEAKLERESATENIRLIKAEIEKIKGAD